MPWGRGLTQCPCDVICPTGSWSPPRRTHRPLTPHSLPPPALLCACPQVHRPQEGLHKAARGAARTLLLDPSSHRKMRRGGGTDRKSAAGSGFVSAKGLNPTTQDQGSPQLAGPKPQAPAHPAPTTSGTGDPEIDMEHRGTQSRDVSSGSWGQGGWTQRLLLEDLPQLLVEGRPQAVGSCPAGLQQLTPAVGTPGRATEVVTNPHPITAPTQGRVGLTPPRAGAGPAGTRPAHRPGADSRL